MKLGVLTISLIALVGCTDIPQWMAVNPCDPDYIGPLRCGGHASDTGEQDTYQEPDTGTDIPDTGPEEPDIFTDTDALIEPEDAGMDTEIPDVFEEPEDIAPDVEPEPDTNPGPEDVEIDAGPEDTGTDTGPVETDTGPWCNCVDDGLVCTTQSCPDGWTCETTLLDGYRLNGGACEIPVTGMTLNATTLRLNVGQSLMLSPTITPEDATDRSIVWQSSTAAASVYQGVVTGQHAGTSTITATTVDGGFSRSCTVTVNQPVDPTVHVTGLALDTDSLLMVPGDVEQVQVTVMPANATNKGVTWTTSAPAVAVVEDGTITALARGQAVITATTIGGGFTQSVEVEVWQPVQGLVVSPESIELRPMDTATLQAVVIPANANNQGVTWSTSDPGVVTVEDGTVTALSRGTTTITASTVEGGHQAYANVAVIQTETWTDERTGLVWEKNPSATTRTVPEAIQYCENLHLEGWDDWRLPTLSELRTLIVGCPGTMPEGECLASDTCTDYQSCWNTPCWQCGSSPGCYMRDEIDGSCAGYWTSTIAHNSSVPTSHWFVFFEWGNISTLRDIDRISVRCVR